MSVFSFIKIKLNATEQKFSIFNKFMQIVTNSNSYHFNVSKSFGYVILMF